MKKTVLICFIHGFKGGESTFGENYAFTHHLRELVGKELPKVNVQTIVYPRYETRGDLGDCVNRFRDWLLEKVIDIEVAAGTPSPTVDPSVRVILIGHSMGGIVAAETAIQLTSEKPLHGSLDGDDGNPAASADPRKTAAGPPQRPPTPNSLMFPYIQGVLAFDTPYLGIAPGVFAHGAEGHYATASTAISQLSGLTSLWGGTKVAEEQMAKGKDGRAAAALPAPPSPAASPAPAAKDANNRQVASSAGWGRWGQIAMVAGAVGAVAAGGAAAYMNREQIGESWSWATSHLEFVSVLYRKEELRARVAYMVRLNRELGVGFGNLYTRLGAAASSKQVGVVNTVLPGDRTFCVIPKREAAGEWKEAVNDVATDETWAHMSMFTPKDNPGYEKLANDAKQLIATWCQNDWYESSTQGNIGL